MSGKDFDSAANRTVMYNKSNSSDAKSRAADYRRWDSIEMETRKPPLTPQQARTISLVVLIAGAIVAVLAHIFLSQPLRVVALSYIAVLYLTVGLSWSFLEWRTHYRVTNTWNWFLIYAILLFLILIFVLDEGDPFPSYAIVLLVLGGAVVAVVMGATALHNFKRWREGRFTPKEEETQPQVGQVSSDGTSSDEPST
jgi:hypothetical protein